MMEKQMKKAPRLRFREFTDDWEQRKLSEVTSVVPFKSYMKEASETGKYEVIQQGDHPVLGYADGEPFVDFEKVTLFGDHTLSLYKPKSPFFVATDGLKILYSNEIEGGFYYYLLEKYKPDSEGYKRHFSILKECECSFPRSIEEQNEISKLLISIDNTITLHQRKLDSIKEYKKGMLQKMFPKKGEKVPEIRFPGFTDEWEQRKLSDITSLITKGTTPHDKSGAGDINFIKVENLDPDSGDIVSCTKISEVEHEGYLKRSQLKEDDILFSIAGTLGRVGIVKSSILPANTNQALSIIRLKEGNLGYVSTILKGRAVEDYIRRNPTIGAQPNLSLEQVGNLEIPYPHLDEQKAIGEFFKNLDITITLHQRKLDELKELKKGLLQQMFV